VPPCALVVDDERDLRENIAELLELEGWTTCTATNGREALEILGTQRPMVVLADLMMPVMNGWQLVEAMKRDDALRTIPVIVVSAHPDPPQGVTVVPKPFRVEQLLAMVATVTRNGAALSRA
jgi:CheY-like chemotaxis protein